MIVVVKKNNVLLIGLIFLLLITIYSLNIGGRAATPVTNEQGTQKTVILDPGHGGEDPGKVGNCTGIKEKDINLSIAMKLKRLLEEQNFNVIITREEDRLEYEPETKNILQKRKQDLLRRKNIMDESGADIVVSIHLNGFPQTQYHGAQTFYPPGSSDSQKLANCIQKSIREMVDPENKREPQLKKDQIIILKNYKTTTTIVECGFLSNAEEEKKLATEEYQSKLADAIKEGIIQYFK